MTPHDSAPTKPHRIAGPRRETPLFRMARAVADAFAGVEDVLLALTLLAMAALPVAEILLRQLFDSGISGQAALVQHGTLVVSMVGATVAARRGRHISLGSVEFLKGTMREVAAILSMATAAAVSAALAGASYRLVAVEREGDATLAGNIPLWAVQAVLPAGFTLVTLHLLHSSSARWAGRAACFAIAAAAVILFSSGAVDPSAAATIAAFVLLAAGALAGAPLFAILGGAALLLNWKDAIPISAMSVSHYSLVVNPSLPAIPLFTLAGYLLANGGASTRLVRLFHSLLGGLRGGPALVTALACAFFTTFTGGSGVTILALGGLLLPILLEAHYSEKNALGLLTGGAALGILFPPCLPLILYGVSANVDVHSLFRAGVLPGLLMVVLTAWLGWHQQGRRTEPATFDLSEVLRAAYDAKWELLLPVIVLVSLFGGFATPVEASALTALYAFVVEVFVYRGFAGFRPLLSTFVDAGLLVGGILLILGVSLGLTTWLIQAEVPHLAVEYLTASVHSPALFLLILNLFLVVVGAMMDIYSAIVVIVPLITPLGAAYGIDPVHLGIIFLTNLQLGYLMPPVGENLFISAYRFDKPVVELYRACLPMIFIFAIGTVAVTYWPWLTMALVR